VCFFHLLNYSQSLNSFSNKLSKIHKQGALCRSFNKIVRFVVLLGVRWKKSGSSSAGSRDENHQFPYRRDILFNTFDVASVLIFNTEMSDSAIAESTTKEFQRESSVNSSSVALCIQSTVVSCSSFN